MRTQRRFVSTLMALLLACSGVTFAIQPALATDNAPETEAYAEASAQDEQEPQIGEAATIDIAPEDANAEPSDYSTPQGTQSLNASSAGEETGSVGGEINSKEEEAASLASGTEYRSGNWEYMTDTYYTYGGEDGIIVTDYYGNNVTELTVPSYIDGKKVTVLSLGGAVSTSGLKNTLVTINIPSTVEVVYNYCFREYAKLKNVNFAADSKVTTFGYHVFECCKSLEEFTMPASLKNIGETPFYGCINMKKLTFNEVGVIATRRESSTEWHDNPVTGSKYIEYVVPSGNKQYKLQNGLLMSKDGTIVYGVSGALSNASITIPSGVTTIGAYAFTNQEGLAHISLPSTLTRVEEYAFAWSGIQELIIPDSVTYLGGHLAQECESLTRVVIGNGVTDLGNDAGWCAFFKCTNLSDVTLGNSVTTIGNQCFTLTAIKTINLPSSLKQINYAALAGCYSLASVTGGSNLETIYNLAFADTTSLTTFPLTASSAHYKFISNSAFSGSAYAPTYPSYLIKNGSGDYVRYDATVQVTGDVLYAESFKVLELVNQERAKQGLSALSMDKDLLDAAVQRAAETCFRWDHERPDGEYFNTVLDTTSWGSYAGENIACGQASASSVMNSWMNSSMHKANILGSSYTNIGIAAFEHNYTIYWVQVFGSGSVKSVSRPSNKSFTANINLRDEEYSPKFSIYTTSWFALGVGESTQSYVSTSNRSNYRVLLDNSCIAWSSGDSSVASVSSTGVVTGKKAGSVTITAKIDKSTKYYTASAAYTVSAQSVTMYRLYNPYSGEHLYTLSTSEYNSLGKIGWRQEGVAWMCPKTSNTPVYRLYNPYSGDHHYTTSKTEYNNLGKIGWRQEGIGFYSASSSNGIAVYRLFNPYVTVGTHHYTKDANEYNYLGKIGWNKEGIAWYGLKS